MKREARLQWLDREIRANRYPNAPSMAAELGIAPRTAWKDCEYLRDELGAPVEFDDVRGGWHYADPGFAGLPLVHLDRDEAVALRHALTVASAYLTEEEVGPLRRLIGRLAEHVPLVAPRGASESAGGAVRPAGSAAEALGRSGLVGEFTRAVDRRHKVRLLYHGAHRDAPTERVIRPYFLHNDRGEWYLLAHCELREGVRTFLLSRVREWWWASDEAAFVVPPDFDGRAEIGRGFHLMHGGGDLVEVTLRFSAYQARWVREREYHPSQRTTVLPDGGLLVRLTVAGLEDVRRWALSFGGEVEVVEPASLRAAVAAEVTRLRSLYP